MNVSNASTGGHTSQINTHTLEELRTAPIMGAEMRELLCDARRVRNVAVIGDRVFATVALELSLHTEAIDARALRITPVVCDGHVVHVVHTPNSLDDIMEIDAALTLADGIVIAINPCDDVGLLVEKVIEKAVARRQRVLVALDLPAPDLYDACVTTVEAVNTIIRNACANYLLPYEAWQVDPTQGTVVFVSTSEKWGFTLADLATTWAGDEDTDIDDVVYKIWNGWSVDTTDSSRWFEVPAEDSRTHTRGLDAGVARAVVSETQITHAVQSLSDCVLRAAIRHVPPPSESTPHLPRDGVDEEWADGVRLCDPNGPLLVHVVKLLHQPATATTVMIGRILSGTISSQQAVSVVTHRQHDATTFVRLYPMDPARLDIGATRVVAVGLGSTLEEDNLVLAAGNLCAVLVDSELEAPGFVTTADPSAVGPSAFFRRMTESTGSPLVLRVMLAPKERTDSTKLLLALCRLFQADLSVVFYVEDSGPIVVTAVTKRHLNRAIAVLKQAIEPEIHIHVSDPFVGYQETITSRSPTTLIVKAPNKHIRLYCTADPFDASSPPLDRHKLRIVESTGTNILIDESRVSLSDLYAHMLYEPLRRGLRIGTAMGVLCDEPVVGLQITIVDIGLYGMERHWRLAQGLVAMRIATFASQLSSSPALLEPVFALEIQWKNREIDPNHLTPILTNRRGRVVRFDGERRRLRAFLPVRESFDLEEVLRPAVGDDVWMETTVDHYEKIEGDPLDPTTPAGAAVRAERVRKYLDAEVPSLDRFVPPEDRWHRD